MTERQSKLIKLVNLYQKIEVSRLAELLDVSQVTIRKAQVEPDSSITVSPLETISAAFVAISSFLS